MNELEEGLAELGIKGNEAKIYLSLLKLKSSSVGEIAKKSETNRRDVYDILEKLINKGLVTYIFRNNVKYFQASDVHNLVEMVKEKEKILGSIMPALKSMEEKKNVEETSVYTGINGLKIILNGPTSAEGFSFSLLNNASEV